MNCGGCSPAFNFVGTKPSGSATPSFGFRYAAGSLVAVGLVEVAAGDDETLEDDEGDEPGVDEPAEFDPDGDPAVELSDDAADVPPLGPTVTLLVTVAVVPASVLLQAVTASAAATNRPAAASRRRRRPMRELPSTDQPVRLQDASDRRSLLLLIILQTALAQ